MYLYRISGQFYVFLFDKLVQGGTYVLKSPIGVFERGGPVAVASVLQPLLLLQGAHTACLFYSTPFHCSPVYLLVLLCLIPLPYALTLLYVLK